MPCCRRVVLLIAGTMLGGAIATESQLANSAEGAHGVWLLGLNGAPGIGTAPPPGVYFANIFWYYDGSASASRPIPVGGKIVAGIDAKIKVDFPSVLWATPVQILGGNLYSSALVSIRQTRCLRFWRAAHRSDEEPGSVYFSDRLPDISSVPASRRHRS
jgi:hypothetical protein